MPGDDLTGAYLASLQRLLPAGVTEEVAGGLADACASYRACGYAEDEAAEAAIAEFGEPEALAAAFTRHSAGRSRAMLATGPPVGAAWGIALITARAGPGQFQRPARSCSAWRCCWPSCCWRWPRPRAATLAPGLPRPDARR
jgi:hypothetical protein